MFECTDLGKEVDAPAIEAELLILVQVLDKDFFSIACVEIRLEQHLCVVREHKVGLNLLSLLSPCYLAQVMLEPERPVHLN